MNAESSLLELSEIFVNENKKNIEEIKQQLEQFVFNNTLNDLSLDLINELNIALNQTYEIYDLSTTYQHLNKINSLFLKLKSTLTIFNPEIVKEAEKKLIYFSNLIEKLESIQLNYLLNLTTGDILSEIELENKKTNFNILEFLLVKLETLLEILEDKKFFLYLSTDTLNHTKKTIELIFKFLKLRVENDEKNTEIRDELKILLKKTYRTLFTILGLITYLKQEKEKTEPPKPTNSFRDFIKRLDLTPEEQLEKNKPAMEMLKKWMKETEEMSEEESQEAQEAFESFKEIIDAERPEGYKLYS